MRAATGKGRSPATVEPRGDPKKMSASKHEGRQRADFGGRPAASFAALVGKRAYHSSAGRGGRLRKIPAKGRYLRTGAILLINPLRRALAVDLYSKHSSQREPPCGLSCPLWGRRGVFWLAILQTRKPR